MDWLGKRIEPQFWFLLTAVLVLLPKAVFNGLQRYPDLFDVWLRNAQPIAGRRVFPATCQSSRCKVTKSPRYANVSRLGTPI